MRKTDFITVIPFARSGRAHVAVSEIDFMGMMPLCTAKVLDKRVPRPHHLVLASLTYCGKISPCGVRSHFVPNSQKCVLHVDNFTVSRAVVSFILGSAFRTGIDEKLYPFV